MQKLLLSVLLFTGLSTYCQPVSWSTANAHSHNDYEQPVPFYTAYNEMFGSIEADIFWYNNELLVAHTPKELSLHRTLDSLYLKPLLALVRKNNGHAYFDSTRRLQLMIDIKTDGVITLGKLVELLQRYPELTQCHTLQIAISGNRPDPSTYASYPSFIYFDGELSKEYTDAALGRIVMMSDDLKKYTKWNGKGNIPAPEWSELQKIVSRSHAQHKPVRFWDAPDFTNAWYQLIHLQVDYINTDSIKALSNFLQTLPAHAYK
jgi:alkaline phosphatase